MFVVCTRSTHTHTRPIKFCLWRANTLIKQCVSSAIKSVSSIGGAYSRLVQTDIGGERERNDRRRSGHSTKESEKLFIYNIAGKEFWENGDYDEKEEESRKKSFSYFFSLSVVCFSRITKDILGPMLVPLSIRWNNRRDPFVRKLDSFQSE